MTSRSSASFSADQGHVFSILGHALSAFSADFCHVLLVPRDCETSLASDFFSGLWVHGSGSPGSNTSLDGSWGSFACRRRRGLWGGSRRSRFCFRSLGEATGSFSDFLRTGGVGMGRLNFMLTIVAG